jgi:hypothetical protein
MECAPENAQTLRLTLATGSQVDVTLPPAQPEAPSSKLQKHQENQTPNSRWMQAALQGWTVSRNLELGV